MTQDEIFEMARQAGFEGCAELTWEDVICTEELVAFAKLIADHEREACIAHAMTSAEKAIDVAIKLERKACAKEVENVLYGQEGCGKAAKAIRARGDRA